MALMRSKPVAFNLENPHEKALYEFVERIPKGKFGAYVKRLLEAEYQRVRSSSQQK